MTEKNKKAVVLLSGGLDSATTLAVARSKGFQCYGLTFRYGQRHRLEIEAAKRVSDFLGVIEHRIIDIDLAQFGGSALTDPSIEVPMDRVDLGNSGQVPPSYVPARNTIFLSYALAWAEALPAVLNEREMEAKKQMIEAYPSQTQLFEGFKRVMRIKIALLFEMAQKVVKWSTKAHGRHPPVPCIFASSRGRPAMKDRDASEIFYGKSQASLSYLFRYHSKRQRECPRALLQVRKDYRQPSRLFR